MPFAVRGGHDFRETMNLEVGGGLIQEFEKRFGKTLTTIVLLLVMVAIVVICLGVIWSGVAGIYGIVRDALPNVTPPAVNVVTAFYVTALVAVAALLFTTFQYFSGHRRVPQTVIDQLAELRKAAVDDILNGRVTTAKQLGAWETREKQWEEAVSKILQAHFPKSEVLGFETLGLIQPMGFPHAFNNEHNFELSKFAKRLAILEDIIRRHTR
jgi:hypothetical protein